MKVLYTDELDGSELSSREKLYLYNGLDCLICREVFDKTFPQLDEATTITYNFMRALQAPVLEMTLRGNLVDQFERREKIRLLEAQLEKLERILNKYALATWGQEFNARSWQQKAAYFYDFAKLPEVRKFDWKRGVSKRTTDRNAIDKLNERYRQVRPVTLCVLKIMDISKQLSTLRTEIDPDGYFRASYNIAGTETGRLASKKNAFGTGCFPPGAEALTPNGWQTLESIRPGQLVCQWERDKLSWAPALPVVYEHKGTLWTLNTEQAAFTVTPNHRVLLQDRKTGAYSTHIAADAKSFADKYLPLSGELQGKLVVHPLLIALLADGNNDYNNHWRITFKKKRKILRLQELAEDAQISLTSQSAKVGYARFALTVPETWPNDFGPWILDLTQASAKKLLTEMRHWDGSPRNKSFRFYTSRKYRADWVQTLAHICGYSATVNRQEQSPDSWSTTPMFIVNVKPRNFAHVMQKHWTYETYEGPVYCLTVPSSYFLVRWNGKICVTGNSNGQNWSEPLRKIFTAPEGPMPRRETYNIPEAFR